MYDVRWEPPKAAKGEWKERAREELRAVRANVIARGDTECSLADLESMTVLHATLKVRVHSLSVESAIIKTLLVCACVFGGGGGGWRMMDSEEYGHRLLEGVVRCTVFGTLVYLLLACLALVERRCAGRMITNSPQRTRC